MAGPTDRSSSSALSAAREALRSLAAQLTGFLAGSEGVFLDAGSRLAGLERQARALVEVSQGAVSRGSGRPDQDPVGHLDRELGGLERYLLASEGGSDAGLQGLSRMLDGARAISGARGDCEDITRTLRVLDVYTRIENARAGVRSGGMESVVAEVRRLANLMESKFRAMLDQAVSLGDTAAHARDTAERFRARQGAWSAQMLQETRGALESLRSLAASEGAVATRAISASEEVVRRVAEVLVALQVHDAIRQMLEHAVEELVAFEQDVGAAVAREPSDAGAWLGEVYELCRVLGAQVRGARERLVDALGQIAGSLRAVAARVTEVGQQTERLAGIGAGASPVERIQQGVGQAVGALRAHLENERETRAALGRVAETAQGIAAHVSDIRGMGTAVRIIALNALVETERTGKDGRTLAVLAREIGVLAVEVVKQTTEVSRTLEVIKVEAGALGGGAASADGAEGTSIAANLESLVVRLRTYHGDLQASAAALRDGSRGLREEVEAIAGRLAEQTDAANSLRTIEEVLDHLGEEAAALQGQLGAGARPVRRASAQSRYTMDLEREIHQRALSGPGIAQAAPSGGASSGLGDNVELF